MTAQYIYIYIYIYVMGIHRRSVDGPPSGLLDGQWAGCWWAGSVCYLGTNDHLLKLHIITDDVLDRNVFISNICVFVSHVLGNTRNKTIIIIIHRWRGLMINSVIIGLVNSFLPFRRQALTWANADDVLLIGHLGTKFSELKKCKISRILSSRKYAR